ncbi:MAG: hypothetical protein JSU98_15960 [Gemmatimonadales bacterium]|nr:MAG: hypothetical protein JSU98_15960 [Gemmatimonadales bacterium]
MEVRPLREVALPAKGFAELRRSLRDEVGALAAVHGLHAAGFGVGEDLFRAFQRTADRPVRELPEEDLWDRLARFFAQKGWGTLRQRSLHPGIGILESQDWAESVPGTESQPSCAFTTGVLSNFLTLAAGGPVAVLEVTCTSRGDDACGFAFGSEVVVHELYGHLLEGVGLDDALARL